MQLIIVTEKPQRNLKGKYGYVRDLNNPCIWHFQYPECQYRISKIVKACCGKRSKYQQFCNIFKKFVIRECINCEEE